MPKTKRRRTKRDTRTRSPRTTTTLETGAMPRAHLREMAGNGCGKSCCEEIELLHIWKEGLHSSSEHQVPQIT